MHLRNCNDYVIVDTPPGFTPEVIASIDSSSHVCMVGMLDSLSLKNTKLGLETLDLMGYDERPDRASCSTGRTAGSASPRDDVVSIVGRTPDVVSPERPGHPAVGQRGRADRSRQDEVGGRKGLPLARRDVRRPRGGGDLNGSGRKRSRLGRKG